MNFISQFLNSEDGAVTVDWVVLTGAIVMLGFVVTASITGGIIDHSNSVESNLTARPVGQLPG